MLNIRNAQALEILEGPANTCLSVVIIGDINAIPNSSTYNLFINDGFKDVWIKTNESPGFTAEQSPDLLNEVTQIKK